MVVPQEGLKNLACQRSFMFVQPISWSLKSIDAKTREANVAEIAIDVHHFVIAERLPGPHPHSKAGENASRRDDRKRNATREAGERPLR
jgi:hypothetical protein